MDNEKPYMKKSYEQLFAELLSRSVRSRTRTIVLTAAFGALAAFFTSYFRYNKYARIRAHLVNGTKPQIPSDVNEIPRPYEEDVINEMIHSHVRCYGIILGPTGTGKSYLTAKVCRDNPSGVIYHHVTVKDNLPSQLAKAVGMKIMPTIIDNLIKNFAPGFENNFCIPEDFSRGLDFVFTHINSQAEVLKKSGTYITLVLDGVDLIAKESCDDFITLVNLTKQLTDGGNVKVVLVSSEGRMLSLIQQTSSESRAAEIVEILDVANHDAISYLKRFNLPLPDKLVEVVGGRMIHLLQCIRFFLSLHVSKRHLKKMTEEDIYQYIVEKVTARNTSSAIRAYSRVVDEKLKLKIMGEIIGKEKVPVTTLMQLCGRAKLFFDVLQQLVNGHLLRYTSDGCVTWHNKIIKNYVLKNLAVFIY